MQNATITGMHEGRIDFVDMITGNNPPATEVITTGQVNLNPFAVAVLSLG